MFRKPKQNADLRSEAERVAAALERLRELDQEIKQLITFAEPAIKKGRRALLECGRALEDAGLYVQQLSNMRSRIHVIQQAAGELVKEALG